MGKTGLHILYVVNVDWFFLTHRLPLARAMRDRGARVTVLAVDTGCSEEIRNEGLRFLPIPLSRKSTNPIVEMRTLSFIVRAYRRLRPDLVHHVTSKPVIYGSLAARFCRGLSVVNAISGLGFTFTANTRAIILRPLVKQFYRFALYDRRGYTVFQNPEHRDRFVRMRLVPENRAVLIRGSGVDCARFRPLPETGQKPIVMLPSRMLWDKGVGTFVEAVRILRQRPEQARFVLVGSPDPDNPSSVPAEQLEQWAGEEIIEWWGHQTDMPKVLSSACIVVLPTTYPEGVPKVLLEAAACGRAIIATDAPGCREIVKPGVNGLLVPPGNCTALAGAIQDLLASPALRRDFGCAGREIAVREFSEEIVVGQTLALYRKMLGRKWPESAGEE